MLGRPSIRGVGTRFPRFGEQIPHIDSGTGLTDFERRWWARPKFATVVNFVAVQSLTEQQVSTDFNKSAASH